MGHCIPLDSLTKLSYWSSIKVLLTILSSAESFRWGWYVEVMRKEFSASVDKRTQVSSVEIFLRKFSAKQARLALSYACDANSDWKDISTGYFPVRLECCSTRSNVFLFFFYAFLPVLFCTSLKIFNFWFFFSFFFFLIQNVTR